MTDSIVATAAVTGQDGDVEFEFVSDRPVLDFVATVAERGSSDVDKLTSAADLRNWIVQSGVLHRMPRLEPAGLLRAKQFREVCFRVISALINDGPIRPSDRSALNQMAQQPRPELQLNSRNTVERKGTLDSALAALAVDLLGLIASDDVRRLHWCADPACTRPFIDRSRGGRRRWCGMRGCGDRAKAAAYRARQRQA